MAAAPSVWVTRARPGADDTAVRVRALGRTPWVFPLLEVEPLASVAIRLEGVGALAFTSANAVRVFAAREARRDLPAFTVGDATAKAARAVGFADVRSADGDVEALAALLIEAAPAGEVLHPGGQVLAGDLAGRLTAAGRRVRTLALYRTLVRRPPPDAPPPTTLDTVLLHSPRAAGALAGYLAGRPAGVEPRALRGLGLSPACIGPLRGAGLSALRAAETPHEDALLALLT